MKNKSRKLKKKVCQKKKMSMIEMFDNIKIQVKVQ